MMRKPKRSWHVVYTFPNVEKTVHKEQKHYESFLL